MKATSIKKKLPAKAEVKENTFPVVAIGASAGGLEAMIEFLKYLPSDTGMAFIYVQHLSPDHKSMLTEILSKKTKMIVQEIDDMDKIKPDNVFVIPYNKGIEVTDGHIKLIPRSESSAAISIDILFSSLAHAQKERVIGVILSGSASDGTIGMKDIKHEGGLTFAQDDTAKFTSMPHSAIAAGMVDFILSPKEIALELERLSKHPLIKIIGIKNGEEDLIDNSNPDLKIILNQLHKATGVDFSAYKMNTIKRRIIRRMLLYKITTLKEYAKMLSQKSEEIDILYQDLLINVTNFFRDTETHKYLKETLFPKLLKRKKTGESLRIWVPACSTGEEAYSIAMMLLEIQESKTTIIPVQIFATDLSQQAISKARIGVFTKHDLETVSPKRIQRFFTKANGGFRVNKAVRDICVFAPHNILRDPPFSRLDFISCCNLFIYFDIAAQKKAVNTFHYALNDDGFLMLGKSENISQSANLFTGFNKKYKIFSRKTNSGTRTLPALLPRYAEQTLSEKNMPVTNKTKTTTPLVGGSVNYNGLDNAIDAVLVSEFMPESVVINHQMEIVQFRGTTDLFLTHPKGKATFNILKMARPEIAFELRNAISKVIKTKHRFRKSGIEIKVNADVKSISVEIVPLKIALPIIGADEPLLLILFTEQEQTEIFAQQAAGGRNNSLAKDRRIKKLEQELAAAHDDALALSQEHEAYTEELQSANEEVVSSNEELQTVNEELETSKEEIESANEELTTTNQELQTRNDLLNEAYDYSEAVIATMHNPMIVLDKNLRVKSANKTFYKNFKVTEEETEGVLLYDLGNKQWNIPRLRELLEDILPRNTHFFDFEITHNFPLIGERIMLLNASRIIQKTNHQELILLAFSDVTDVRKKALELLAVENKYLSRFHNLLLQTPVAIGIYRGSNYVVELANDLALEILNKDKNLIGTPLFQSIPELESQFKPAFDSVMQSGIPFHADEFEATLLRNDKTEKKYFNTIFEPIREDDNTISGVIVVAVEITEQVIARKKIEDSERVFRLLTNSMPQKITNADADGNLIFFNQQWVDDTGLTFEELKDWGWEKALHPDDLEPTANNWKHSVATGDVFDMECRIRNKEGVYRWHLSRAVAVRDANEKVVMWVGSNTDIHEQVLAKRKIEESEQRYNLMVMQSPFAFAVLKGKNMVVTLANDSIKKMWGKGNKIEGKPLIEVLPEIKDQGFMELLDGVYTTGIPYSENEKLAKLKRQGKMEDVYFNFVYQPYREADQTISGVAVIAHEVTTEAIAKRQIEESEKKFKQLAELTPQKVWTADAAGNKIYFNQTFLDYTGLSLDEIKDRGWTKIIHPDDFEENEKRWQHSIATGNTFEMESRFLRKDGKYLWHLTLAVPLKDEQDNIILWIGSKTEIQEQKKAKDKAEAAQLEAEEAMHAKQQFLSNMSHEIRTPLNSILGFTNVLLKTELGIEQKEFVQAIKTSGKTLNALINDILDLAKVDAGKMVFVKEPFEMQESITSVVHSFDLKIKEKNLEFIKEFDSNIPSILLGDSIRLNQIILNLISNAIKFTHKGKIMLRVKLLNEDEENMSIEFTVSDSGIGIAANKINSIFNLFEQAESITGNAYGGTGLGLAIVKQLIEAQGGSISLRSTRGEGATFSFILPFGKTNITLEAAIEIPVPDSENKNLRVLIAEDVALNQLLIKIILNDFGFVHEIADNGKIAIEKLQTNTYDIILMDLQMPEMNGFEATEYIRKTMKLQIPIIALTADVTTVDVAKCKEFGMDDYISKPINENLLYSKIMSLVKGKQ